MSRKKDPADVRKPRGIRFSENEYSDLEKAKKASPYNSMGDYILFLKNRKQKEVDAEAMLRRMDQNQRERFLAFEERILRGMRELLIEFTSEPEDE